MKTFRDLDAYLVILLGVLTGPPNSFSSPLPVSRNELDQEFGLTCDPLHAEGTAVLCFPPPETTLKNGNQESRDCLQPSVPGTTASYSCRNFKGDVYTGFLKCVPRGIWMASLRHANNSLCNLDGSIVNIGVPDVVVATELPDFTTPAPSLDLLQTDASIFNDYEKLGLQLHNIFRRNHGVPMVKMIPQLNKAAQQLADSIAFEMDVDDVRPEFKLKPINRTMNIEMNWYFQAPPSNDENEAMSNAVQKWYSTGFLKYDWGNVENNLEKEDALAFARLIWRSTQLIGVGVSSTKNFTFVAGIYTPGRNIESTNPAHEFRVNVPFVRIG